MVSFQAPPLSPNQKQSIPDSREDSSKKRKWDGPFPFGEEIIEKRSKPDQIGARALSLFDVDLQLETPLPLEWQRCLDIQSGQIHFYNTRTQIKTSRDPRSSTPEPPIPASNNNMSLNLELNLRCDSTKPPRSDISTNTFRANWLGLDVDHREEEMVAKVCMRCHMLVMLCKSSPACPNCKYMNTPDQSPSTLFKPLNHGHHVASKIKASWY